MPSPRSLRLAALALLAQLFLHGLGGAAEIPDTLAALVLHPGHRGISELRVAGTRFETVRPFSELPYLLWLASEDEPPPFARDRAAAEAWIARASAELGHAGFVARFNGESSWRGDEVWEYGLSLGGVPLRDGRVRVHWDEDGFVGIVNAMPGKVVGIDGLDALGDWSGPRVYYALERGRDRHLRLARVVESRVGLHSRREFRDAEGTLLSVEMRQVEHPQSPAGPGQFTEFPVLVGTFPDQIAVDSSGLVWFSQPNDDFITSFDAGSLQFTRYPSPPGSDGPDGLLVDAQDRVWTGMYYSGELAVRDPAQGTYRAFDAPYASAQMAIPIAVETGRIWVTDHARNRISEFDPLGERWVRSLVMPSPNVWVVAGDDDPDKGFLYLTEFNVHRIARVPLGGTALIGRAAEIVEIPVHGGGPAFLVHSDGKVFYSQWNEARLGQIDLGSGLHTDHVHPVPGEFGGPLCLLPDGDVVVGTRADGYILVFHVATETWSSYDIPTHLPGLKDGLTSDADGVIWFTETVANKIARLVR